MTIHNLPLHATSFVGRQSDLDDLSDLLADPTCRLLTLVGPGGIGKTRLALEIASREADRFADGVYFVALQPLYEVESILTAVVDVLPLQLLDEDDPQQELLDYLYDKCLLLVLDNFEHLLDGVAIVSNILTATTQVKLIVTSRERLNLHAEQVWPLNGLDLPGDALDAQALPSAVQLFDERARRAQPGFLLQAHLNAVADICRAVDGTPLALELAASWVHAMPCETIAGEIQHNIDILVARQRDLPDRHQSMRAVFDHSWRLLSEDERAAFSTLSVFRGGFTAEAAIQVAGVSLHTLASLIDKSLVQLNGDGRYDLHELLRQYGEKELETTGKGKSARDAHGAYYADFVFSRVEDLKGRRQFEAIAEFNADFENVRAAWTWAADRENEGIIEQMIDGLWIYCRSRYRQQERTALFRYGEKKFAGKHGEESQRLWGRLLSRAAVVHDPQKEIEIALEIARRYNDPTETAFCLAQSGYAAYANQEYDKAVRLFEQSLTLYRQLGDHYAAAEVLFRRVVNDHQSDWDYLKSYADEALRLRREIGDRAGIGWSLAPAALHEGRIGHFAEAERLWRERIALGQEVGNLALVASGYAHISHRVYFFQGDFAQARAAADEAIKLGSKIGASSAIGWALPTLGLLACMDERYAEGTKLCQQAATVRVFADIGKLAAWGVAIASCGLGDYEAARANLSLAFKYLTNVQGTVGEVVSLPIAAIICAHQSQPVRAVELLALAFTHPVRASGWMEKWPLLDRLQADLELTLGSEAYSAAWERGKHLNLDSVIVELKAQLFTEGTSASEQTNRALPDPLSPRELEVLTLIADGLTNREIAARLFVGVSTVKKHIQHIYAKLDTRNRTGTIVRARELDLIP